MRIVFAAPEPCIECGSDPIGHTREYWMLLAEALGRPLLLAAAVLGDTLTRAGRRPQRQRTNHLYDLLERAGLGEFLDTPDEKTMLLDHVLWEEAAARGIRMREFRILGLPTNSFVAVFPTGERIQFESIPVPQGLPQGVWWTDTKSVMKKKFAELGIPVAQGGSAFTLAGAQKIFKKIGGPVIVKPYEGSASRHTTLHINDAAALAQAFRISAQVSPKSIIEKELKGAVYRPTLVNGKLIATLRRNKPQVVGDGVRTISELIEEANKHPKRGGPYYSKIVLTPMGERELAYQNMTLESVPEKGRAVILHPKISWSLGGTTTDVTDEVHPDNKELFEKIAGILHAPVVGIDFIIEDISASWKEQTDCGVIECNGRPFFDNHHLPFEGTPRNVAGAIWDLVKV